ncbi:MAG: hypothetical protein SGJ24_16220 [Chloroflexota bacterium]|nr:hypothetical protein [Chloroflexota bacterium]
MIIKRALLICTLLVAAACSSTAPADDNATALPPVDTTSETARQEITPASAPPIVVETASRFDDMALGTLEIVVSGDLTADSSTPGGESPNAIFNVDPSNSEVGLPERQLVISLPVASVHSDGARLNLTLYIAEGGGAGAMIKADGMTPDQYGVRALLLPLIEGNFLEVSDPNILAVSGDMRVLENGDRLTAAFDFTITNGQTNQTVRVVGRVNGLSLS